MALFCNKFGVDREEVSNALLKRKLEERFLPPQNPEQAMRRGAQLDDGLIDHHWLCVSWVFHWHKSFKLLWKYLVASVIFEEGQLGYIWFD
jgi:hypothetical protein